MVRKTFALTTCFLFASALSPVNNSSFLEAPCQHKNSEFRCVNFLGNYDGDTLTVDIIGIHPLFGFNAKIRVFGVDTPELRSKSFCEREVAKKAKQFVYKELSNAKDIKLIKATRGKYFRIVATVIYDGQDLAANLIKEQLAVPYDGGTKPNVNWCSRL